MPPRLRTLLILGRVSNLPTIWSNCLAGWWLGGGGHWEKLPLLLFGASALYVGGAFLNDAFDTGFDRQRHPTRPIPSGAITREWVWIWSSGLLTVGTLALAFTGKAAGILALVLLACVVIYDAAHRAVTASPWLMGLCRFWLYVIAGATGAWGVNGWPIWCGAALAFYIAGLSFVAQRARVRGAVPWWPLLLLAAPIGLAMLMNSGAAWNAAALVSFVLALWTARTVWPLVFAAEANVPRVVSGLLAGIVLVDWLAVAPEIPWRSSVAVFLALFGATKLLQRFAPAA